MANPETLTLAFVAAHPLEAARILERLDASDSAALFERMPARVGAPVLMAMLSSAAARIITLLSDHTASSLLANCGTQATVRILRQIGEPKRSQLVAGLPTTAALASRLLLHYPDDSIGASTDPDIVVFPPGTTVADAIAGIANGKQPQVDLVFSVDHGQRLVGAIAVHELLRKSGTTQLASVVQEPRVVLTAGATISGLARRRGRQQAAVTPVIDRDERLIGVLRREALDRAMARLHRPVSSDDTESVAVLMARGYWSAFSVLADASVSLLPQPKPIVSDDT